MADILIKLRHECKQFINSLTLRGRRQFCRAAYRDECHSLDVLGKSKYLGSFLKIKNSENDTSKSCFVCGVTEVGGTDAGIIHLPAVLALRTVGAVAFEAGTPLHIALYHENRCVVDYISVLFPTVGTFVGDSFLCLACYRYISYYLGIFPARGVACGLNELSYELR